jgi:hypothetical protein
VLSFREWHRQPVAAARSGVDPIKFGAPGAAGVPHPQQRVVVDRAGVQMLHDYETRLLFILIVRRMQESV